MRPADYVDVMRSGEQYGLQSLFHPASYEPAPLESLAEFVFDRGHTYAAVLISGDLATSGLANDLRLAFEFVSSTPTNKWIRNGQPVLNSHSRPLIIVPGNHDNYTSNAPAPSGKHFALQFGVYLKNYVQRVGHNVLVDNDHALCVVYADFSFLDKKEARNLRHLFGGGKVAKETLEELQSRTLALRSSDKLRAIKKHFLWMIHFAPFDCGDSLELLGYRSLIEAAVKVNVKNIICGHTHISAMHVEEGVKVLCGGSASSVGCVNAVHEVFIDKESDRMSVFDYKWSSDDGQFTDISYRD